MTKPIKDYLTTLIPQEQRWKITLFQSWDTLMGPLKDKVSIAQINNDILLLKVIHPAWAQELFLLSSMLKQKINTCLGTHRINTIRFVTSDIKPAKPINNHRYLVEQSRKPYTENITPLTPQESLIIANVKDDELKQVLKLFFSRCKYLKKEFSKK